MELKLNKDLVKALKIVKQLQSQMTLLTKLINKQNYGRK